MAAPPPTTSAETPTPIRRPYHGSCHCGHIKYIVFVTLPPEPIVQGSSNFYKCNCTTCHKMGFFHMHVPHPPQDFLLLSPLAPEKELGDYRFKEEGGKHWYFCPRCGVRCFTFAREGEVVEVDLEKLLGKEGDGKGEMTKIWRPKVEGWLELEGGSGDYLSINAHTVEAGQEGFDLREVKDKGWLQYVGARVGDEEDRFDYPHEGGTW